MIGLHHRVRNRERTNMDDLPPYLEEFLPDHVGGILVLLNGIENAAELTPAQVARIREILHLQDDRTVAERVRDESPGSCD